MSNYVKGKGGIINSDKGFFEKKNSIKLEETYLGKLIIKSFNDLYYDKLNLHNNKKCKPNCPFCKYE